MTVKPPATHCMRGHEYTPSNTYIYTRKDGYVVRACRQCQTARENKRRLKRMKNRTTYYPM